MTNKLPLIAVLMLISGWSIAQCVTPNTANNLFLSATDTSISVYFDSTATANEYLGIVSTNTLSANPVDGTTYSIGSTIGGGTVVYKSSNYVFKIDNRTPGVTYRIYVFSVKKACGAGEPKYSAASLSGSIQTFSGGRGIPTGYYNTVGSLTCAPLKTALYNIIKPTVANPDPTYKGILGASQLTDGRRNDNNTQFIVWDQYSDNPTGAEAYEYTFGSPYQDRGLLGNNEGERYNREHTFPQAWFGGQVEPMYSDQFIVYPSDKKMNGLRANFPYGSVGTATYTSANGSKLGASNFAGYVGTVFEPINTYKGDLARANFYVVTAYENLVAGWQNNTDANAALDGTAYPAYDAWYIKQLYQWHIQDPVSQKEIDRNNSLYMIQGSRNPYIDHPEYVALVWQCTGLLPVTLIDFKATRYHNQVNLSWFATRESQFSRYVVERSNDGLHFNSIGSILGSNLANYRFTDVQPPASQTVFYRLRLVDVDGRSDYSKIVSLRLYDAVSNALLYPNPARDILQVRLKNATTGNGKLSVLDITGRILQQQTVPAQTNSLQIDVRRLPAGKYVIELVAEDQLLHDSFLIVR